ncbi:THAP domain-containing protein 2-like [Thalassophryne amazonica]|uniref:THAP domain-containing protein 2-like n=1 Tax=Thalassophryne amazonica TaxID=390379 RepID=UPI001470C0A7|nr:THAP domain-containing protein 2-like [Thalassophryne amazonica]
MSTAKRKLATKGAQCFAINCLSYRNQDSKAKGITFHKFPDKDKKPQLYQAWVRNCRRDTEPSPHARICSKHFQAKYISKTLERTYLAEDAVPDVFELPEHLKAGLYGRLWRALSVTPVASALWQRFHLSVSSRPSCCSVLKTLEDCRSPQMTNFRCCGSGAVC